MGITIKKIMQMEFTSQLGQDKWVCEALGYKKHGYFLDIGACDGITFSNTYYLEKELAWNGICIEAGKVNFGSLVKNRGCICVHKALSNENKVVEFKEDGVSGMISEEGDQLIEAITIDKLMIDYNVPLLIDYISLDIEGMEYEVLTKFLFDKYKVALWTIEHNAYIDKGVMLMKIESIMIKNGYLPDLEMMINTLANCFESFWINSKLL